ncbi:MAG: hypothetical protein Q7W02_12995 [Candidatus Rokubacteria bacterium]|nr:hypothetical protein [Candidatus Rokubacteria bacterium]
MIARGATATIRRHIDEHWAAGAGHVCIQALNPNEARPALPDEQLLAALAPKAQPCQ